MNSIKKNYFYNIILTLINIAYPLITAPYVSRILGASNLGKVIEMQTLTNILMFISFFGVQTYGIREIAKNNINKKNLTKVFSELIIIQFVFTLVALLIYLFLCFIHYRETTNLSMLVIYFISLFFNCFSVDWVYSGIEKFKYITLRNLVIKIASLILIFIFVKKASDYTMYGLLIVIATICVNIVSISYVIKTVQFTYSNLNIKRHLNKLVYFFITSMTWAVYGLMDQIVLGAISNYESVAFLNRGKQILTLVITFTNSLSNVLLPRLTNYYSNNRRLYLKTINKSINLIFMICLPTIGGITLLAKDVMYLLGGNEFASAYKVLVVMSPWLIICSLATFTDNQISIPTGNEKITTVASISVATVSLMLNFILIPKYSYIGSAFAYVIAELVGLVIQVILTKLKVNYKIINKNKVRYLVSTIIMCFEIMILKKIIFNSLLRIIIIIPFSMLVYFFILIILRDEIINTKKLKNIF